MAWIESHQELERHPKTLRLMSIMGWSLDETIGKLHRFWWWCVDYALDGDLRKFNDAILGSVVGLNPDDSKRFVEAMVGCGGGTASGFMDRQPYFRIHDWWDRVGMFLQIKFKHQPEKWQVVRSLYLDQNGSKNGSENSIPNLTKPNQTKPKDIVVSPGETGDPTPDDLLALWNKTAHPNLPRVRFLTEKRKTHAKCRLRENPEKEFWEGVIQKVNFSPHCRGENGHAWKASFDWILNENNLAKILEGNYDTDKRR